MPYDGDIEKIWAAIAERQGKTFYTTSGLPFTYEVKGGELFASRRRGRSISKSTFKRAFEKIVLDPTIHGPKRMNLFGGPYIWSILNAIGAVTERQPVPTREERERRRLEEPLKKLESSPTEE